MWLKITRRFLQLGKSEVFRFGEEDATCCLRGRGLGSTVSRRCLKRNLNYRRKRLEYPQTKEKKKRRHTRRAREREREREGGKWKEFLKRLRHPKLSIPGTNLSRKRADDSILMATTRTAVGKGKKSERGNGSEQKYFPSFHQFNYSNNRLTLQKGSVEVVPFTSRPNLTFHRENRSSPQRNGIVAE